MMILVIYQCCCVEILTHLLMIVLAVILKNTAFEVVETALHSIVYITRKWIKSKINLNENLSSSLHCKKKDES
jgi:hypothetical protein